jgi:hypothetical protein
VINEVMWMGSSGNEYDEWIELRNTTGNPVNLNDWKIDGAGSGSDSITLSGTIPASGYFLISHYDSSHSAINNAISVDLVVPGISLKNDGEQLTLKSAIGVIIDQTPSGAWAAGEHTPPIEKSMERNDNPSTGWHTCINDACNDTTYWDTEGSNYGTPKAANLSENDPTLEPSPEVSSTPTLSPTPETSPTPTPTAEPSPTQDLLTLTPTPILTAEPTLVPSTTPTPEPSSTPTPTPTPSPSPELSPTASSEPSPSPSPQPSSTPAPTSEPTPTLTPTPSPTSEL